jgi:hypothetical protein
MKRVSERRERKRIRDERERKGCKRKRQREGDVKRKEKSEQSIDSKREREKETFIIIERYTIRGRERYSKRETKG